MARPNLETGVRVLTLLFGQVTPFLKVSIILFANCHVRVDECPQSSGTLKVPQFGAWGGGVYELSQLR